MGTTDTYDSPLKAAPLAAADKFPIMDSATGRAATATIGDLTGGSGLVVAVSAASTVLTVTQALHGNRTMILNNTAPIAVTLPAATGTGASYKFVLNVAATATQSTIKVANTVDVMQGLILSLNTTAGALIGFKNSASSDTITLNGTTTGGGAAAVYTITDIAAGFFQILGMDTAAMTTTPLSATV